MTYRKEHDCLYMKVIFINDFREVDLMKIPFTYKKYCLFLEDI